MAIKRTTKAVAKRIDLGYFKRFHALRSMRKVLAWIFCLITIGALGIYTYAFKGSGVNAGIYNPGPVSRAHAYFEQDCKACHDADGSRGFFKTVSDKACLTCHDGPMHDMHQASMIAPDKDHHAPTDMSGQHMVAADCKSCHVEHRGHEALAATSDAHCTVCHENLKEHIATGVTPKIKPNVMSFTPEDHPAFGRELAQKDDKGQPIVKDGKWVLHDSTVLSFNHQKHMGMETIKNECTLCHNAGMPPVAAGPKAVKRPPFTVSKEQPFVAADKLDIAPLPLFDSNSSDRRFMEPISYERSCSGCHAIQLIDGVPLSHASLQTVRAELANLPQRLAQQIATDPDKEKKLTVPKTAPKSGPPGRPKPAGAGGGTEKITEEKWVENMMAKVKRLYDDDGDKYAAELAREATGAVPLKDDPGLLEFEMVKFASSRCDLCHTMEGQLPQAFAFKLNAAAPSPTTAPSTAPAAVAMLQQTVPTRMPTTPRRWFTDSHFNHDSHRNLQCVACHGQAMQSTLTSDVLMPGIEACAGCHHPSESEARRSSGSDCVMCHNFHDRTHERSFDGTQDLMGKVPKPAAPATQVAKTP